MFGKMKVREKRGIIIIFSLFGQRELESEGDFKLNLIIFPFIFSLLLNKFENNI